MSSQVVVDEETNEEKTVHFFVNTKGQEIEGTRTDDKTALFALVSQEESYYLVDSNGEEIKESRTLDKDEFLVTYEASGKFATTTVYEYDSEDLTKLVSAHNYDVISGKETSTQYFDDLGRLLRIENISYEDDAILNLMAAGKEVETTRFLKSLGISDKTKINETITIIQPTEKIILNK